METLARKKSWNSLDRFLSRWRSKFILPYLKKDDVVCDIGCGQHGSVLINISDRILKGYGFDFNLREQKNPRKNIFLSNQDFRRVNEKFDVVIMLAVLEHFPYPEYGEEIMQAVYAKLKVGGTFILTTPDKKSRGLLEFLAYRIHIINEEEIRDHKHYFDKSELIDLMRRSGFTDVRHYYFQLGLNNLIVCKK